MAFRRYFLFVYCKRRIAPMIFKFAEIHVLKIGYRKLPSRNYYATNFVIKSVCRYFKDYNQFMWADERKKEIKAYGKY